MDDLVLSASRDTTAISWQRSESGEFFLATVFRPGSRYVNAITYLPPTADAPKGSDSTHPPLSWLPIPHTHRLCRDWWSGDGDKRLLPGLTQGRAIIQSTRAYRERLYFRCYTRRVNYLWFLGQASFCWTVNVFSFVLT